MPVDWTAEQASAMAPDEQVARSAVKLAAPEQWLSLGREGETVWGAYKGSGQSPYQPCLDVTGGRPAYRCTCPSRKQPCKHVVGLALMLAGHADAIPPAGPPVWVVEWRERLRSRRERQPPVKREEVADPDAQARRSTEREAKVAAGIELLERWLCDLVRAGLAEAQVQDYRLWEDIAARMIDSQARGLSDQLRPVPLLIEQGDGWPERLLDRLSRVYLLVESYKRLDALPPGLQAEVRARVGWTVEKQELLAQPGERDRWVVMGRRVESVGPHLNSQRTWLWGRQGNRAALVLDFAPVGQSFETALTPGHALDAALVFYPGAYPLRALVKPGHAKTRRAAGHAMPGACTIAAALEAYAAALARNPWLEHFPAALQSVVPVRRRGAWGLRDEAGHWLPLARRFDAARVLAAISGGYPCDVFGEWDGERLRPLGVWVDGRYVELTEAP